MNSDIIIKKFSPGEIIVKEGADSLKFMIVVLKGRIGVYQDYQLKGKEATGCFVRNLDVGDFHSFLPLFLNHIQAYTLVALTDVSVSVINRTNVGDFFSKHTDMAVSMVESICKKYVAAKSNSPAVEKNSPEPIFAGGAGGKAGKSGAAAAKPQTASGSSELFPQGHGSYTLPMSNDNKSLIYSAKSVCPLCNHEFDNLGVLISRLRRETTDPDGRERYSGAEPIYYEIITCPNCLLSVHSHNFTEVSRKNKDAVYEKISGFKKNTQIQTGWDRDTFTVFAGYYLALLCAETIFDDCQVNTGGLWLKIARMYSDCKDKKMEKFALQKSFDDYNYAYMQLRLPDAQSVQVCYVLAELYYKLGNLEEARNYFHKAKTDLNSTLAMKRKAERRMEEVRTELKQLNERK